MRRNERGGAPEAAAPALSLEDVSMRFGGVTALDRVSLEVGPGEIHSIVGENGSGKSTLVKVLGGYHAPEPGSRIRVWGREVDVPIRSPGQHGIAIIHQDLGMVASMSVVENFGVAAAFGSRGVAPIGWATERARCRQLCGRFGVGLRPEQPLDEATPAERAMLAILRTVRRLSESHRRCLLVLDEPTAYLTSGEVDRVVGLMRSVRAEGASVIFISHRLKEVLEVSDRLTVLRDGKVVQTLAAGRPTQAELIRLMLGREIGDFYPAKSDPGRGEVVLELEGLAGRVARGVDLQARAGEIVGVTGLAGMGQDELPYLVNGSAPRRGGRVRLRGRPRDYSSPKAALADRVVLVPANRQRDGAWLAATALENITLASMGRHFRRGRLDRRSELGAALELMRRFGIRPLLPGRPVASFSGGNQQKIVLARWLQGTPAVLLLHEPTQGVDAGARKEILELVKRSALAGAAVVVFSADYEQLANSCHRVVVLREGRVHASIDGPEVSEDRILTLCNAA